MAMSTEMLDIPTRGWTPRRAVGSTHPAHDTITPAVDEVILVDVDGHPVELWCPNLLDWSPVTVAGVVVRCAGCELSISPTPSVGCGALDEVDATADGVAGELEKAAVLFKDGGLLYSTDGHR